MISAVEEGIGHVGAAVPYDWDGHVVVYALSDTDLLEASTTCPASDPDALDAVSFPVPAELDGEEDARWRAPGSCCTRGCSTATRAARDRLIRHELTHVALGSRDDDVPTWLGEGIAEYVSVAAAARGPAADRQAALDAAEAGLDELPADLDFNDADPAAHYGISWWACEYDRRQYGEPMLWRLLDELAAVDPDDQDDELQQTLADRAPTQLAREAGEADPGDVRLTRE